MIELSALIPFLAASVLLTITPGPDLLYVITQSMAHGKRAGIITGMGLCTGLIFHTAAVAGGVALILSRSDMAFLAIQIVGAGYILYLGVQALFEKAPERSSSEAPVKSMAGYYRTGILMNVLNPKVTMFFLGFLPQFVNPASADSTRQIGVLGALFILQAIVIFILVSYLADVLSEKLLRNQRFFRYMTWFKAAVLIAIGLSLGLSGLFR